MFQYLTSLPTCKRILLGTFLVCCFMLVLVYKDEDTLMKYSTLFVATDDFTFKNAGYLVDSYKCRMPDLDPFNPDAKKFHRPEKYTPCSKLDLLTYVTKTDNIATLHVDNEIVPSYSKSGVSCCYSYVTRQGTKDAPDNGIKIWKCVKFKDNVTLTQDIVHVKCQDTKKWKTIYENVHNVITVKKEVREKLEAHNGSNLVSVLFVGIDSISRLNFIRSLPQSHEFVEVNGWTPLKGYNKVADNTFPNVMAILTGFNQSYAYHICDPRTLNKLDACPFLWYDFRRLGYVTAYAEDETTINTFNYNKKGFTNPPVDYYLRPYIQASEKLKMVRQGEMNYCTGPETAGERILHVAKDFSITFKDNPSFGFFWMNTFSHNQINSPSGMDKKIKGFLEDLTNSGVLDTTIVIFLSDHGIRFGKIRYTATGWLEERLPFIYISIPDFFKKKFPTKYSNLQRNAHKLTTPYDLHMTLQDILVSSGLNFSMKPSDACPKCKSLFDEIESERSCEEAAIAKHWCTCSGYKQFDKTSDMAQKAARFIIDGIHERVHEKKADSKCAKYSLNKILTADISENLTYSNETYLLMVIETAPSAVFESTVQVLREASAKEGEEYEFDLKGGISRLDRYFSHSHCTDDAYLKMFCYCR